METRHAFVSFVSWESVPAAAVVFTTGRVRPAKQA